MDHKSLRDYLHVVVRRKWVIVATVVLVTAAALGYSLLQEKTYQAASQVLLGRQNLANLLSGLGDQQIGNDFQRIAQTQAELARSPEVAALVLQRSRETGMTPRELLDRTQITVLPNADLLEFRVTDVDEPATVALATAWAESFVAYRRTLDNGALEIARRGIRGRVEQLDEPRGELYDELVAKDEQLSTIQALQGSNVSVARRADEAALVAPRPLRNLPLGIALGLALGLAFAFLREALDTRVRSAEELTEVLGLPLVARLPEPPRRLRESHKLVMMEYPNGAAAEPLRLLRSNVEFLNLDRGARTIMVTSAVQGEGKSTIIANLAVALARSGKRVVLVDLDFRRSTLARFFDAAGRPGVTEVALGEHGLDDAIVPVPLGVEYGADEPVGSLGVLTAGALPPDVGEFVGGRRLASILRELRERADLVLLDTPPVLKVSDGMTLSTQADAVLVAARMNLIRRPMMQELARLTDAMPADKLGFVLTGDESVAGDGYGYGYGYGEPVRPERRLAGLRG
ncbi:P-loop NTPase [Solirubrobacter sp. CPCC 204708]|uniref:Wzz/FepE/Etk N-terminal domain-containing protein n=1 Tax=Solirubrobacter deserti TaxID=2282478 RepID=A0ABT4RD99_9ACTN|nr:polysaccharide biosynthesis tyrosine autokinase [Solirubrobacter deserti]MBE2314507.1 P-loop NTPase [Solirubrobacter deserti]MDA0136512.1 Wzz/FepE/Etk N-terminal domain-containing protein [Solirubrobacter deserti]